MNDKTVILKLIHDEIEREMKHQDFLYCALMASPKGMKPAIREMEMTWQRMNALLNIHRRISDADLDQVRNGLEGKGNGG